MAAVPVLLLLLLGGWLPGRTGPIVAAVPSPAPGNETAAGGATTTESGCDVDIDCRRPGTKAASQGVVCDQSSRRCICGNRTLVLTKSGLCLPTRLLGQRCMKDVQCHRIDKHAECEDGYCKCEDGYYLFNDINGTSCLQDLELQTIRPFGADRTSESMSEENMVPIIVCLAIMFVGMCVALQLFSR